MRKSKASVATRTIPPRAPRRLSAKDQALLDNIPEEDARDAVLDAAFDDRAPAPGALEPDELALIEPETNEPSDGTPGFPPPTDEPDAAGEGSEEGVASLPDAPSGGASSQLPAAPQVPQVQVPVAIALPEQTRRVREDVLPSWHVAMATVHASDPAVADHIMTINAIMTMAEQAMMTQNVGQMIVAHRSLSTFQPYQPAGQAVRG